MEEGLYEAEYIIEKKVTSGRPFYLVKWKGYPLNQCTWEPPENFIGCKGLISDFENSQEKNSKENEKMRVTKKRGRKRKRHRGSVLSNVRSQNSTHQGSCDRASSSGNGLLGGETSIVDDPRCVDLSSVVKLIEREKTGCEVRFKAELVDGSLIWISDEDVHQHLKDQLIELYERILNLKFPEVTNFFSK